jgi:hypothetical protein
MNVAIMSLFSSESRGPERETALQTVLLSENITINGVHRIFVPDKPLLSKAEGFNKAVMDTYLTTRSTREQA